MANAIENFNPAPSTIADESALLEKITQSISANLQYEAVAVPDELIKQLHCIAQVDQRYTQLEKFWLGWMIGTGVALLLSGIASFATAGLALWVAIPIAFCFVWCIVMYSRRRRMNIPDRRHQIPAKLLKYLKTDMPPDRPASIEIDFRHYFSKTFQTESDASFFSSTTQKNYEVPWLKLSGQLYDGTKFRLKITNTVKRKEKRKRKRTKITETFRDKYNLTLAVKPQRYPGLAKFEQLLAGVPKPQGLQTPQGKVDGNRVTVQAISVPNRIQSTNQTARDARKFGNPHPALQLFVSSYHCLGQCRQV